MKKTVLLSALIGVGVLTTVASQTASATHPRPKGATPIRVPFVPAFKQCTSANRTHGAPLAFPSCNPPVQASSNLTIGTPDANGAAANAVGFALVQVVGAGTSSADVKLSGQATDIRCKPGVTTCGSANSADGPDYTGEVQSTAQIRITDHYNGPGLNEPATVQDIPFPTTVPCSATADTTVGGLCSVVTSANAIIPGAVQSSYRAIVESAQIQANDGGVDGLVSTGADNQLFAVQGIFLP
jgi:hypothetical protein